MDMLLATKKYAKGMTVVNVKYRPGTTDEKALREVIDKETYRKGSMKFDVLPGERWLDLGGNIGAFAVYCQLRGATTESYEPIPSCYHILQQNIGPGSVAYRAAVTHLKDETVPMWVSSLAGNHYRGTTVNQGRLCPTPIIVPNIWAGDLPDMLEKYDGVKMDIEGSEFGIIDNDLIPKCKKLCFEYHTSRDQSMDNMKRRIDFLRSKFKTVGYTKELDHMMKAGGNQKSWNDRVIFCMS